METSSNLVDWSNCSEVDEVEEDKPVTDGNTPRPLRVVSELEQAERKLSQAESDPERTYPEVLALTMVWMAAKVRLSAASHRAEKIDWSGCSDVEKVPGKVRGVPILKGIAQGSS